MVMSINLGVVIMGIRRGRSRFIWADLAWSTWSALSTYSGHARDRTAAPAP